MLVAARSGLQKQLASVKEEFGAWTIDVTELIPSKDDQKCTIRYTIYTEKTGSYDVIAILSSQGGQHIDSVDEVYYKVVEA